MRLSGVVISYVYLVNVKQFGSLPVHGILASLGP